MSEYECVVQASKTMCRICTTDPTQVILHNLDFCFVFEEPHIKTQLCGRLNHRVATVAITSCKKEPAYLLP